MTDRSESSPIVHDIEVTHERLQSSLLLDIPLEARQELAAKAMVIIRPLWNRLAAELESRIIDDRAANTMQKDRDLATRSSIENEIFTGALLELLPAARKLTETQTLAENIQLGAGLTTRLLQPAGKKAIDSGLRDFAAGKFLAALQTWAMADDAETIVRDVQAQRQTLAAELVEQANMACDVIKDLDSLRLRYEARDTVKAKALEPIERLGTEKQRDQANWVYDELEVLLSNQQNEQPARKAGAVAAPLPTTKKRSGIGRFILVALALIVVIVVVVLFVRPGLIGIAAQPSTQAPPQPTAPVVDVPAAATAVAGVALAASAEPLATTVNLAVADPPAPTSSPTPEPTEPPAKATNIVAIEGTEPPAESATAPPVEATALPAESATAAAIEPTAPPPPPSEETTAIAVTTAAPDAPPLPGRIAFTSRRNGNQDIFVMPAAGGEQFNVTQNPARDFSPAWSPDGTQLVFISDREGGEQLFIINADGTGLRRLTVEPGRKSTPSWSPDGANIIFQLDEEIFLARVQTGTLIQLSRNNVADTTPSWADNGQRVVYSSFRTGDFEIFYTDTMGSQFTRLTNDPGSDRFAVCAPDGSTIAFLSNRDGRQRIYLMNPDGTNQRPLDLNLPDIRRIAWSPDGKYLVFDAYDSQTSSIYAVGVDGTGLQQITEATFDLEPAWGP